MQMQITTKNKQHAVTMLTTVSLTLLFMVCCDSWSWKWRLRTAAQRLWWWMRDKQSEMWWTTCLRRHIVTAMWIGLCARPTLTYRLVSIIQVHTDLHVHSVVISFIKLDFAKMMKCVFTGVLTARLQWAHSTELTYHYTHSLSFTKRQVGLIYCPRHRHSTSLSWGNTVLMIEIPNFSFSICSEASSAAITICLLSGCQILDE